MKTLPMPKITQFALIALIITGLMAPPVLLRGQGAAQGAAQQVQHDPSKELAMKITQPFTFAAVGDIIIRRPVGEGDAGYQALARVMREADMTYANMEGPILDEANFRGPLAGGPKSVVNELKRMGVRIMTDANNHTTTTTKNAQGLTSSVQDARLETTTYAYDAYGNLTSTTVAAGARVAVYDVAPTGTQVAIVTDTGEFYFVAPPAGAQSILSSYQATRYSDTQILDALQDGMNEMWPDIWLPAIDTSIIFTPSFTEYTLPSMFNDPRVQILSLEVQPPSGILISLVSGKYDRVGLTTLKMGRGWPAGSIIRIVYNGQYTNLADLEQQVEQLPVYYACYKILMDQETMRTRSNDLVGLSGEGSSAPEVASATAQLWLDRFKDARQRLAVARPTRSVNPDRSVEMLESGTGFSWNPL